MPFIMAVVEDEGILRLDTGHTYETGMKPPVGCPDFDLLDEAKWALAERQAEEPKTCLLQIDREHFPKALWLTPEQFDAGVQEPMVRAGCAKVPYDFLMLRDLPSCS